MQIVKVSPRNMNQFHVGYQECLREGMSEEAATIQMARVAFHIRDASGEFQIVVDPKLTY